MKKIRLLILALVLSSASTLYAGAIKNAFTALNIYDYFKARTLFIKSMKHDSVASCYGLSIILSRNDNHFYNIDTSYYYILKAKSLYSAAKPKQKLKWKEDIGLDSMAIIHLKDTIELRAFKVALTINSIDGYNHFIKTYPTVWQVQSAVDLRDVIAYTKAEKENTYQAYKSFMDTYLNSTEYADAKKRYEISLFKTLTADHAAGSFVKFIKEYPESPYIGAAEDSVYHISIPHHLVHEYYDFVKEYPHNPNVTTAWHKLYTIYTMDGKPETFARFHIQFPDYPYSQHADTDFVLAQTHFYPVRQNNMWGYIDSVGRVRIPIKYEWVDSNFYDGLAAVAMNDKIGFINKRGELTIPCIYEEADHFRNTISIVKKGSLYGIITTLGQTVVPFEYQGILNFSEGMAVIEKNSKYGYISLLGEEVVSAQYQDAGDFSEGLAYVQNANGKYGYIDIAGVVVIPCQYDWVGKFKNGIAKVRLNSKFGLIGLKGDTILNCEYDNIGDFADTIAMVVKSGKVGYIGIHGEIIIPLKYEFAGDMLSGGMFHNGLAKVQLHKKRGFINTEGKVIVRLDYDDAMPYAQGLAPVMADKKWGYINKKGMMVIRNKYDFAGGFCDSLARVSIKGQYGFIDVNGKLVIPAQYDAATDFKDHKLSIVTKNNLLCVIDKSGTALTPCQLNNTHSFGNILQVEMNGKMAMFRLNTRNYIWQDPGFGK